MNAKYKAVMDFFNCSERGEGFEQVLERNGMTADDLMAATDEVLVSGNDIEGAAIGIAALYHTYPNHESNEYLEAESRVLNHTCLLLRLQSEPDFPGESALELKVEEMLDIISNGAERLAAGFPLDA